MPRNIKGSNFRIHLINYIMPYFLAALYLDNKRHSLSLNQKVNLAPLNSKGTVPPSDRSGLGTVPPRAAVEYSRLRFLRKAPVLSREARAYYATPSGANRHLCRGRGFFYATVLVWCLFRFWLGRVLQILVEYRVTVNLGT